MCFVVPTLFVIVVRRVLRGSWSFLRRDDAVRSVPDDCYAVLYNCSRSMPHYYYYYCRVFGR